MVFVGGWLRKGSFLLSHPTPPSVCAAWSVTRLCACLAPRCVSHTRQRSERALVDCCCCCCYFCYYCCCCYCYCCCPCIHRADVPSIDREGTEGVQPVNFSLAKETNKIVPKHGKATIERVIDSDRKRWGGAWWAFSLQRNGQRVCKKKYLLLLHATATPPPPHSATASDTSDLRDDDRDDDAASQRTRWAASEQALSER